MQFYLDGYRPGDPLVEPADPAVTGELPSTVDVLIVGAGPAGLVLAAQLAAFPELRTVVVDRRDGPLQVGQADGVACRTVEMFEAFGLADRLIREGYQVNEVTFWSPDPGGGIVRTGRIQDVEDGLSEMPHMIVNQARVLAWLREHVQRSASRAEPFYGLRATAVRISDGGSDHPVTVGLQRPDGTSATVRARYVVGCDGARSAVREAIGRRLAGDVTNQAWGVLDVLAVTDFPDIRLKSAITSAHGNVLVIPREGGYLVRLYVELDPGSGLGRDATPEQLVAAVNRILHPYTVEVRQVGWWAVYEIGQRLCDRFDDVPAERVGERAPRVFIAGDACHTHSAKAGQGMNVSMADAWNLGWKLAAVLGGRSPEALLGTYSQERQEVARELIEFDREFSARFARTPNGAAPDPAEFARYFARQGRFTAGVAVRYAPSMITGPATHQRLATGFEVGTRFHSAPVVRLADARPVHLGHAARADGAWRLYAFADRADPADPGSRLRRFCAYLGSAASAVLRVTPPGADPDSVVDLRAVLQQHHRSLGPDALPAALLPRKGPFGLVDHEKVFCPDPGAADVFDLRGVDRESGCVIVVRPDQYVAHVLPLDAHEELDRFLSGVLLPQAVEQPTADVRG